MTARRNPVPQVAKRGSKSVEAAIEKYVETLPPGQWVQIRVLQKRGKLHVEFVGNLSGLKEVMQVRRSGGIAVHKPKGFVNRNLTGKTEIKDSDGNTLYMLKGSVKSWL